ncbi:MAG: hypothetical protein GY828_05135 [Candidatus Gracilibacteria bacterium]|nr:hypothetical protein [Candidatus Gracilibacteria bacterium]
MKDIEKYKKYLEEHYPETTDEQRERFVLNLYKLANYSFNEFMKKEISKK